MELLADHKPSARRMLFGLACFAALFLFGMAGTSWASGYTTTQLTNNSTDDLYPEINAAGQIVWYGYDGQDYEIYLYSGGQTIQLTNNNVNDSNPVINDAGQIAWTGSDGIYLYDAGVTTHLVNSGTVGDMNGSGQIAWIGDNGHTVYLHSGGVDTPLANYTGQAGDLHLNDSGQAVWEVLDIINGNWNYNLYLYENGQVMKLAGPASTNTHPRINASGQVVWQNNGVYFHSGGTTSLVGPGGSPQINDFGQIVWENGRNLYLYSGGVTAIIATGEGGFDASMNNSGDVVWMQTTRIYECDPSGPFCYDYLTYAVDVYRNGTTSSLQSLGYGINLYPEPRINDSGVAVWQASPSGSMDIFMGTPQGEIIGRPELGLSLSNAFWASYADYSARELSINMSISNAGPAAAYQLQLLGSISTNGVTSATPAPFMLGNIPSGWSMPILLRYHVPDGVQTFRASVYVSALDANGVTYSYPGPYPG